MHLSHHEFIQLEAALGILYAATSLRSLQHGIMRAASLLVPNQWVSYNETSALLGGKSLSLNTAEEPQKLHHVLHALWHEHPTVHPRRRRDRTGPVTFTDCLERKDVERLALYNEYYRVFGIKDQMVLFLDPGDQFLRCVSISRDDASFTGKNRAVINFLHSHFYCASRQVSLLEHLACGQSLIVLTPGGVIEFISDAAGRRLREACGPIGNPGSLAPAEIRAWLQAQLAAPLAPPVPLQLQTKAHVLTLRLTTRDFAHCTIVVESIATASATTGNWHRLTPREREVLAWIAQGKSNPEVATILQMSRRTVEKHMEGILAKLALENRAQAMRAAFEQGLAPENPD